MTGVKKEEEGATNGNSTAPKPTPAAARPRAVVKLEKPGGRLGSLKDPTPGPSSVPQDVKPAAEAFTSGGVKKEAGDAALTSELKKIFLQSQEQGGLGGQQRRYENKGGGGGGGSGGSSSAGGKLNAEGIPEGPMDFRDSKGKVKKLQAPFDYAKNYPMSLPLREPYAAAEAEEDEDEEMEEGGKKAAAYDEDAVTPAAELQLLEEDIEERLLFLQLPPALPLSEYATGRLGQLPGGRMGTLRVYESGAVKLQLGSVLLDVNPGAKCIFHQELAAINNTAATCHFLGDVRQRAVLTPDVISLLGEGAGKA
eukprot:jgi/Mesen1/6007/ME000306S05283